LAERRSDVTPGDDGDTEAGMAVFADMVLTQVPLDQRRHYLACMEELKREFEREDSPVARIMVLEDRERLGHFLEIIEYASREAQEAAGESFRQRLTEADGKIEALLGGRKRERRAMLDRL
jgi:hypothetical protein